MFRYKRGPNRGEGPWDSKIDSPNKWLSYALHIPTAVDLSVFFSTLLLVRVRDSAILMTLLAHKLEDANGVGQTAGDGKIKGRGGDERRPWTWQKKGLLLYRRGHRKLPDDQKGKRNEKEKREKSEQQTEPKPPREKAWWGVVKFVGGRFGLDLYFINHYKPFSYVANVRNKNILTIRFLMSRKQVLTAKGRCPFESKTIADCSRENTTC